MIAQFYGGGFVFYDKFIELCRSKGVKPTPLVLKMGLSSSNVSQWKKGSTPRPEVLQKFAEYFNVSVEYLLTGEAQKEKPPGEGELDNMLIDRLVQLTPEELEKVDAFVQGLIAAREV